MGIIACSIGLVCIGCAEGYCEEVQSGVGGAVGNGVDLLK